MSQSAAAAQLNFNNGRDNTLCLFSLGSALIGFAADSIRDAAVAQTSEANQLVMLYVMPSGVIGLLFYLLAGVVLYMRRSLIKTIKIQSGERVSLPQAGP